MLKLTRTFIVILTVCICAPAMSWAEAKIGEPAPDIARIARHVVEGVEQHFVGRLDGFRFTPDTNASGIHGKAARHAAAKVMVKELSERVKKLADAKPEDFALTRLGEITWEGAAYYWKLRF